MKNFTSNTNKHNLQSYNINNLNFVEEEDVSDFSSIIDDEYINLDDINKDLDELITVEDRLEGKENLNESVFQLNINAFQSAHHFSTNLNETDNIDDFIAKLDSNFDDDESVISKTTDITNEIQSIEIPKPTKLTKFTFCVLIDNFNGEIRSCGNSQNLHCIKNIFEMWEIDNEMVNEVGGNLASLGVCYSYQIYDQTKLHVKNAKETKDSSLGFISNRKCLFCNINKSFYTCEEQCDQYSWTLVGCNLQVPCGGQYYCTSLTEINPILYPSLSNKRLRSCYICTSCYEKHNRHFHQRSEVKEKVSINCQKNFSHKNDIIESSFNRQLVTLRC